MRNLDPEVKARPCQQPARHGRSMEAEARAVLTEAVARPLLPWLGGVARCDLYTTTIMRAEIRYGIARLPRGKRRTRLEQSADDLFAEVADRMLAFDSAAAASHASVATGDTGGFEGCGIPVIDPFVGG